MLFSSLPFSLYFSSYFTYSFTYTFAETKKSRKPLKGLKLVCVTLTVYTSYSFTMRSDTDDQFNELVTLSCSLQPYSRMNQVSETDLCYKQQYLYIVLQWHISIDPIISVWPEDRSKCCHTSMDCDQERTLFNCSVHFHRRFSVT